MGIDTAAVVLFGLQIDNDIDTDALNDLLHNEDYRFAVVGDLMSDNIEVYIIDFYISADSYQEISSVININDIKEFNPEPDKMIEFCDTHKIKYIGYPNWKLCWEMS